MRLGVYCVGRANLTRNFTRMPERMGSPESYFNLETCNSTDLARVCADSAAQMQRQDPQIFWGSRYGEVIRKSAEYIEQIGLAEAKKLFKEGKLNFPDGTL